MRFTVLGVLLVSMMHCSLVAADEKGSVAGAESVGPAEVVTVCAYSRPPFLKRDNGRTTGIEKDILASFAQATGRQMDLVWFDEGLEAMLASLPTGECDIAAAMLTPTSERAETVDFSAPYFPVRMVLLGLEGHRLHDPDGLEGARIATVRGASYEAVLSGLEGVEKVYGGHFPALLQLVRSGEADALACDSSLVVPLLAKYEDLAIGPSLAGTQHYAFALAKGSALLPELDAHLLELRQSGRYAEILETYLDAAVVEMIIDQDDGADQG